MYAYRYAYNSLIFFVTSRKYGYYPLGVPLPTTPKIPDTALIELCRGFFFWGYAGRGEKSFTPTSIARIVTSQTPYAPIRPSG